MHDDDREARNEAGSTAPPEWSVDGFGDFAPFEDRGVEEETEPEGLQFGLVSDDDSVPTGLDFPDRDPTPHPAAGGHESLARDRSTGSVDAVDRGDRADEAGPDPAATEPAAVPSRDADRRDERRAGNDASDAGAGTVERDEELGSDARIDEDAVPAADRHDRESGDDTAEDDETVETAFEGGESVVPVPAEEEDAVAVPDFASFTSEAYEQTTTQEFVDLAAEMAEAAEAEHEPSAVTAEMPGLESGIVGLEDVVVASGEDPGAIPVVPRSNLAVRIFTGLGLAIIFFASLYDPLFVGLFVFFVLTLSAGEFYSALLRAGYRPLVLFGLLGTVGALAGTWIWSLLAVPVAVAATLVATLLFFGIAGERRAPMTNVALTVLGTIWIGGMGSFIFVMVQDDDYGWLIVATVVTVALMDIASYFFGRRVGRHRLAPRVSPKKTLEGLIGGMLIALLVGVAFGLRQPFDLESGLLLGAIVAVAAPFGDLAVSLMKRTIGVKDMGTLLPGHGGLLDRIDAMLFVLPLAWIAFSATGLLS